MQTSSRKHNRSTAESQSSLVLSCSSFWNSTERAKYSSSKGLATGYGSAPNFSDHMKESESQFQEQDSSSTLSPCQSHCAMGNTGRNNSVVRNHGSRHVSLHLQEQVNVLFSLGDDETFGMHREHQKRSSLAHGNADYAFGQVQFDYNHSMACIPYQWAESCVGALVAAYGPNALVYPQMLGINQSRVPIPLNCAESIPVYVNAKQFRAILRRRQMRAKLEAQNKFVKSCKPYLHESRHLHALKRPRGSGGRFLNTKATNQSKPLSYKQLYGDVSGSDVQHSDRGSWETSTPSGSDVTSIFSGDDIFQQPEIRHSRSPFHMDARVGDGLTHLEGGNRLLSSINGGAPK